MPTCSKTGGDDLRSFPVIEVMMRKYAWVQASSVQSSGTTTMAIRCNSQTGNADFIAFYTDNRHGELTFAIRTDWAHWERHDNGNIVIVPKLEDGGIYIFSPPSSK